MAEENKESVEGKENEEAKGIKEEEIKKVEPKPVSNMPESFKFVIGKKLGMTQVFDKDGNLNGATIIDTASCRVVYVRDEKKDGYKAVALGFGNTSADRVNLPQNKMFEKLGVEPVKHIREFRLEADVSVEGVEPGQIVSLEKRFKEGDWINVRGISKGKGFAGAMKRHNFAGGPASHGASDRERAPGSISSRRSLGRVLPGQRMAGHMGSETVTMEKIKILKIDGTNILVGGGAPGARGSLVYIAPTSKVIKVPVEKVKKTKKKINKR